MTKVVKFYNHKFFYSEASKQKVLYGVYQQTLHRPIDKEDGGRFFGLVEPPIVAVFQNPSEQVQPQPKKINYFKHLLTT